MWTRRAVLSSALGAGLAAELDKRKTYPSEWRRFLDPATEFEVVRLTDPAFTSRLPAPYNRAFAKRGGFLIYASDRNESQQLYRMDLKNGECRQITQAAALDPDSASLLPDDRAVCYVDGTSLRQTALAGGRDRELYVAPEGWRVTAANVTGDGVSAVVALAREEVSRLVLVGLAKGTATEALETRGPIADPMARPRRAQILYRSGDSLRLVNFDGKQSRTLKTAPGGVGNALWTPNGRAIVYLHVPEDATRLNALRELTPDENSDKMVAPTSQFARFGMNADATVFVGASRNRNSPHVLILVRAARRELTVCLHGSSDAARVGPVFSTNSQRVYFHSDRHGKMALYQVRLERFVEKTESENC
ncbi:MAG: oligogalacturonate lyase family protein [Bryobacteraceae bacterium]